MPDFKVVIQFLILVLILGAAWFLFKLGADYIGLPPVAMTIITVLIVVGLIVMGLKYLQSTM